jgi:hypothetical protein
LLFGEHLVGAPVTFNVRHQQRMLAIVAATNEAEFRIAWINESANNSLSVGLADRAPVSPRFHARQFLWNAYNRVTLQYLVPGNTDDLLPVRNPHLTFHPPVYFHLRANDDEELFAGIADVRIMLEQDSVVPWIRFVARPVREMRHRRAQSAANHRGSHSRQLYGGVCWRRREHRPY